MTWQPIDTAPKDGTWILVWGGKTDEDFEWDEDEEEFRFRPVIARWSIAPKWRDGQDSWRFANYEGGYFGVFCESCQPTHWQPLPPLPDHPSLPEEAQQ